jgi:GTP-binding protein
MEEEQTIESTPVAVPIKSPLPLVAIVGRPNVGKSTLFNRITGRRTAIVGDEPGITRDRIYGEAEWNGKRFRVVDTGGIVPDDDALIPVNIFKQASAAIDEAQALIWVADVRAGVTSIDEEIAQLLRGLGKRVLVAANKADAEKIEAECADFFRFGFANVFPVSAEHANGVGDLLDELVEGLSEGEGEDVQKSMELRLAIVGRPNVGKSSILNRLLGEERVIVSPIAGTTRDAVDTTISVDGQAFRLIDTAGIRRKGKTYEMAEKLSVIMAKKSLERADVAIVVIDAADGVAGLDANIAGYAHDAGCSIIIAVNKWDAVPDKLTGTPAEFERNLRDKMKFLDWAPVVMVSALSGQRIQKLLPLAIRANEARNRRVPTAQLNDFFERAVSQPRGGSAPAPVRGGLSRLRVKYMTQAGIRPPTFILFTAGGKPGLHFSYTRYLMNRLREEFDFFATPLKLVERHRKIGRKP